MPLIAVAGARNPVRDGVRVAANVGPSFPLIAVLSHVDCRPLQRGGGSRVIHTKEAMVVWRKFLSACWATLEAVGGSRARWSAWVKRAVSWGSSTPSMQGPHSSADALQYRY